MNKSKDLFNQPGTKITLEGITAGIAGFKLGKYLGTKYTHTKKGGLMGALSVGLAGFGLGLTIGAWEQYGFSVPISKGQVAMEVGTTANGMVNK